MNIQPTDSPDRFTTSWPTATFERNGHFVTARASAENAAFGKLISRGSSSFVGTLAECEAQRAEGSQDTLATESQSHGAAQ